MNLASWLQGIAQPGSIVVSERVHRLAGGSFEYEDLGEQRLKGIARPIYAYRIVGVSEAASRFEAATQEGLTPLVALEQEIGLLLERWALAQDGEGQVVLLSGEPGIGKSRILSALRERLEAQGGKAVLAEAMAVTGDLDNALCLIDEQIAQVERPGWEERAHYAEILRLKGWMLSLKGDLAGAERTYLASLDWSREQQARSWELRTSTSLAKLWQNQGKRKDALDLLRPVYDWFTEGFDTKDLIEAKALLDELGESR
jgi:hypothetical protein